MKCNGKADLHTDSGYRRMIEVDDVKGYGMRGLCLLRCGERRNLGVHGNVSLKNQDSGVHGNVNPKNGQAVHLLDSACRSHRQTIRSSYSAETLAAANGYDDAYPTSATLVEFKHGVITPAELKPYREQGWTQVDSATHH